MASGSCPLVSCAGRGGKAVHLLCAALAVCFALYLYLTWRELQRMDAKVTALAQQMSGLHTTTDAALKEMRAALEPGVAAAHPHEAAVLAAAAAAGGIPVPVPLVFEHVALAAAGPQALQARVHVHGEGGSDDGGSDGGDGGGGDYDEDADDRQIKGMLMTHLDGLEEAEEGAEEGAEADAEAAGPPQAPAAAPSQQAPSAMKLDELRRALRARGLDARGTKEALAARLEEATRA